MNKERILALADLIEKQPHVKEWDAAGFNMNRIVHPCGTPSCIAGWAAWEENGRPRDGIASKGAGYTIEREAADYLGISYGAGCATRHFPLFYPRATSNYSEITNTRAAAVLRHLAETGEVDWSIGGAA